MQHPASGRVRERGLVTLQLLRSEIGQQLRFDRSDVVAARGQEEVEAIGPASSLPADDDLPVNGIEVHLEEIRQRPRIGRDQCREQITPPVLARARNHEGQVWTC